MTRTPIKLRECPRFQLDSYAGVPDYISGLDVYYTQFAIFGLTFYTSQGYKYSCPGEAVFVDTSAQYVKNKQDGDIIK